MIRNPDKITIQFNDLSKLQSNFGTWIDEIRTNALGIDKVYVYAPDNPLPKANAGIWKSLQSTIKIF